MNNMETRLPLFQVASGVMRCRNYAWRMRTWTNTSPSSSNASLRLCHPPIGITFFMVEFHATHLEITRHTLLCRDTLICVATPRLRSTGCVNTYDLTALTVHPVASRYTYYATPNHEHVRNYEYNSVEDETFLWGAYDTKVTSPVYVFQLLQCYILCHTYQSGCLIYQLCMHYTNN
jgi:hypothetical protein